MIQRIPTTGGVEGDSGLGVGSTDFIGDGGTTCVEGQSELVTRFPIKDD